MGVIEIDSENRSRIIKKNIALSFIFKIIGLGLSYFLVPITLRYLDKERYGIWVTLLSIMSWLSFLDIGIGNGLRNKLAEAVSKRNFASGRSYIITAYITISILVSIAFLGMAPILSTVNWAKIFNTHVVSNVELKKLMIIITGLILVNLVLSNSKFLFYALQSPAMVGLGSIFSQTISLLGITFLMKLSSNPNLIAVGIIYGSSLILSNIFLTIFFFRKYPALKPKISGYNKKMVNSIMSMGIKFFAIQIAAMIIFTTSNLIITQVLGPIEVTRYNIAYKLFRLITMGFGILITPFWSAFTDAKAKSDLSWSKEVVVKLNLLLIPIGLLTILLIIFIEPILKVWLGKNVIDLPTLLPLSLGIFTIISVWNNIYANFLNGVGLLNVQMMTSIFASILNIPLAIYLSKNIGLGSAGVVLANCIVLSFFAIAGPIQTVRYFKQGGKSIYE